MSNLKAIVVLSVFLLLLLAANLAVRYGAAEVKASGRRVLVEDIEGLCAIRIEREGKAPIELGKVGSLWRLRSPYSGSVDEQVVMKFLDSLAMTPITDVISDSALLKLGHARADFALVEPPVRVVLSDAHGVRDEIGFGVPTPLAGGVFASVGDLDSIFVVSSNLLAVVDVDAARFRRRSLFTIGPDAVASFDIKRKAEAPLEFVRSDSEWKMRGASVSGQKVKDFLSGLTSAEALDFVWPVGASNETEHASAALLVGYGLDPDTAVTVTIKGVDGKDRRISFGMDDGHGHAYALVQGGAAIVTVPAALKDVAGKDEGFFADSRLFPVEARSVGAFAVSLGDARYALVREKGGGWSIESPIVAKADDGVVDAMLSRILALSTSDLVAAGDGVSVSLATNAAKTVVSRASVFGELAPEALRSKEIMKIDPTCVRRIVRIEANGANSSAVVYDRERKSWNLEEGQPKGVADVTGIDGVLSAVNPLVAERIERLGVSAADLDDYGLDTPFLTVAIDQDVEGAVRRNIIIGKATEDGRFATIGSSDAVFVIGNDRLGRLAAAIVGK